MRTSRAPIILFCIITFIAFEIGGVGQSRDVFAWTAVNAVCCVALWLFADAHVEIVDTELGDLLATGYHPLDPRHPRNTNAGIGDDRFYPQVMTDNAGRNLVMLRSSEDCYASPFSMN